jgi:hypothetical protein
MFPRPSLNKFWPLLSSNNPAINQSIHPSINSSFPDPPSRNFIQFCYSIIHQSINQRIHVSQTLCGEIFSQFCYPSIHLSMFPDPAGRNLTPFCYQIIYPYILDHDYYDLQNSSNQITLLRPFIQFWKLMKFFYCLLKVFYNVANQVYLQNCIKDLNSCYLYFISIYVGKS